MTRARLAAALLVVSVCSLAAVAYGPGRGTTAYATTGVIDTIAGSGIAGYQGDGGAATAARLKQPNGMVVTPEGDLLVADRMNNVVRKVDGRSGIITTIAGIGSPGFSGDGGPATAAQFTQPQNVTLDANENIYVSDTNNNRVRRIDKATGEISTIAGTGSGQSSGDTNRATDAGINSPQGIHFDPAGNLVVASYGGRAIRRIDAQTGVITTIAGILSDAPPNGRVTSDADGKLATQTNITRGTDFVYSPSGDLVLTDIQAGSLRIVDHTTGIIHTLATRLGTAVGVAVDKDGNYFVADQDGHRVRRVAPNGLVSDFAGTGQAGFGGDGRAAASARLRGPEFLAFDAAGSLYISEIGNHRIRVVEHDPVVTGVSPAGGPAVGGNVVDVTGAGFVRAASVTFGTDPPLPCGPNQACRLDDLRPDTVLHVTVPRHVPATAPVSVTSAWGSSSASGAPTYTWRPPVVSGVTPADGPATGGTGVVFTGTDLQGAHVTFGGVDAFTVQVAADGSSATATSPPAQRAGAVALALDVPVAGVAATVAQQFAYHPAITAVAPSQGELDGGAQVIVTGKGFGAGIASASFGDTAATVGFQLGPDQVVVVSPPHAFPENVDISLTSAGLDSIPVPTGANVFSYGAASGLPASTRIDPGTASVTAGSSGGGQGGTTGFTGGGGFGGGPPPSAFAVPLPGGAGSPAGVPASFTAPPVAAAPGSAPGAAPVAQTGVAPAPGATPAAAPGTGLNPGIAGLERPEGGKGAAEYLMAGPERRLPALALGGAAAFAGFGCIVLGDRRTGRAGRRPAWGRAT